MRDNVRDHPENFYRNNILAITITEQPSHMYHFIVNIYLNVQGIQTKTTLLFHLVVQCFQTFILFHSIQCFLLCVLIEMVEPVHAPRYYTCFYLKITITVVL